MIKLSTIFYFTSIFCFLSCGIKNEKRDSITPVRERLAYDRKLRLDSFLLDPLEIVDFKNTNELTKDYFWTSSTCNCDGKWKLFFGDISCFDFIFAKYDTSSKSEKPARVYAIITTARQKLNNPNFNKFKDSTEILVKLYLIDNVAHIKYNLINQDTSKIRDLFGDYTVYNDSTIVYKKDSSNLILNHCRGKINEMTWFIE